MVLTEDQIDTIIGYVDGAERVMGELGIDRFTLDAALLNYNVERCKCCGQYDESYSFTDSEGDVDGYCDNCRRYEVR